MIKTCPRLQQTGGVSELKRIPEAQSSDSVTGCVRGGFREAGTLTWFHPEGEGSGLSQEFSWATRSTLVSQTEGIGCILM